jgi:mRNA-degrading endonuclease RelE of RelBE toxin-antitoxin system
MAWKIEFERAAQRELEKLDKPVARLICSLEHDRLVVLVLRIGHRRGIYSR